MIAELQVADGSRWGIAANDRQASVLLQSLVDVMGLRWTDAPIRPLISVITGSYRQEATYPGYSVVERSDGEIACSIVLTGNAVNDVIITLRVILGVVGRHAQANGGMLIHSALAEIAGRGVAMAGRGGIGKTTASRRLPLPWRSLCDDSAMIARDQRGNYWAHPLPTASEFCQDGTSGRCNFRQAVPLHAIFFLDQALEDRLEPLSGIAAVGRLLDVAMQAAGPAEDGQDADQIKSLRTHLFDNACALAKKVPCAILHLSLNGPFWLIIQRAI